MDKIDDLIYIGPLSVTQVADKKILEDAGIRRAVVALNGPLPELAVCDERLC